jgi:hypothetical protein
MKRTFLLSIVFLGLLNLNSWAQSSTTVKRVDGKVTVQTSPVSGAKFAQSNTTLPTGAWIKTSANSFIELESSDQSIVRLGPNSIYNETSNGIKYLDQGTMLVKSPSTTIRTNILAASAKDSTLYVVARGAHGETDSSVYVLDSANNVAVKSGVTNTSVTIQKGQAVRAVSRVKDIKNSVEKFNPNEVWSQTDIMQRYGLLNNSVTTQAVTTTAGQTVNSSAAIPAQTDEVKQEELRKIAEDKIARAKEEGMKKKEAAEEKKDILQQQRVNEAEKKLNEVKDTKNRAAVKAAEDKVEKLREEAVQDDLPKP